MALADRSSSRRNFLARGGLLSALAGLSGRRLFALPGRKPANIYERFGVRTRINAKGTYTYLSGSLMPREVSQAMEEAAQHYVYLVELQEAVGRKIAEMLGAEAAMVTSGAAGAIALGTAACVTGHDPEKILRIPDTSAMKNEVIIQKSHRMAFDHAIRNVGVQLVVVESLAELDTAISEKTAMMFFLNAGQNRGQVGIEKFIEVGKRRGIPTFNDAAADVPPLSHLSDYLKMGFDLVAFSGGKGLRGPQCAGLLLGRKDLIEAALLNNNPHEDTLGRPMKVGKEEIVGMYVALERYLRVDHDAEWKDWEARLGTIEKAVSSFPGIRMSRFVPEVANHVPHLRIEWNEAALGMTQADCARQLEEGEPSIVCLVGEKDQGLGFTPYMMMPGEEKIVARRLKEIFTAKLPRHAIQG
jgi:L-seryl-tRNA(Ser) seleniumtransferase